jgi:hypothetical protein
MSHFDDQMAHLEELMRPAMKELHRNTSQPLITDKCPEHWDNVIIFGQCWRHNPDGSLKSTFTKSV